MTPTLLRQLSDVIRDDWPSLALALGISHKHIRRMSREFTELPGHEGCYRVLLNWLNQTHISSDKVTLSKFLVTLIPFFCFAYFDI